MFSGILRKSGQKLLGQLQQKTRTTFATSSKLRAGYALEWSTNAKFNKLVLDKYMCLPTPDCKCQVKYIWIDGTGENLRGKTRTLDFVPSCYEEVPKWSYDGSSCFQAHGEDTDIFLIPVAMYKDPFRRGNNKLVLCETYDKDLQPTSTNHRAACADAVRKICKHEPQFGLEQEYQLMDADHRPLGWPAMRGEPEVTGLCYCGVGSNNVVGRDIVEAHYRACLYAGLDIAGSNAEVTYGQWEFQIGVSDGIKGPDDLWMGRFILNRMAEEFGVWISYHPKLFPNWNGAGCHTNFSTKEMRDDGGLKVIEECICKLSKRHKEHMKRYDPKCGEYNKLRLTGLHETSSMDVFTHAVGNRSSSVRIHRETVAKKKGYFEDRRPSSNCDPYAVCDAIVRTCYLDEC
ncbi:PREDICTED: glutamine synthetase 2 cytoplasmic-like [Nicrophorus vespilloides]|uniref:glutamine synthetase n=1 Tax=Nicrophorus vespilloides TaxID=110193 RepID=A0ABM1N5W4_NICVS|nr:PREDICTED: glutamine synthetase 2 cytoplasmic-like [Nicrophorus vespilloides]